MKQVKFFKIKDKRMDRVLKKEHYTRTTTSPLYQQDRTPTTHMEGKIYRVTGKIFHKERTQELTVTEDILVTNINGNF